ncbi:hypothetical protein [Urbifossiella limnaea]|nr:hypothetical protein [Urbifossiella limnaea]
MAAPRRGVPLWAWIVAGVAMVGAGSAARALVIYLATGKPRDQQQDGTQATAGGGNLGAGDLDSGSATGQGAKGKAGAGAGRALAPDEHWDAGPSSVQFRGASVSGDDFMVFVAVRVADPKEKVTFRSWRDPLLSRTKVKLTDNNGTVYHPKGFDLATEMAFAAAGQQLAGKIGMGAGAVYSNRPHGDLLLFEKPTPAAEYLDLDLDGSHVEQRDTIRFRVPREVWASALKLKVENSAPQPKTARRPGDKYRACGGYHRRSLNYRTGIERLPKSNRVASTPDISELDRSVSFGDNSPTTRTGTGRSRLCRKAC